MPLITDFIDYDAIPVEHREAVEACVVHNIVAGKDNGAFDPYGNVTYGELCKQICTIENLGTDIVGECTHETLGKYEVHHWAAPYIQLCREHGIYSKDGNTFSPDQSVIYSDVYDMLIKTYHFLTGETYIQNIANHLMQKSLALALHLGYFNYVKPLENGFQGERAHIIFPQQIT